jgi:hypothetical protein
MSSLALLAVAWRARADELEPFSAAATVAFRRAADELQEALVAAADEELTLQEAHDLGGYAPRSLRQMIADGKLENVGRRGAPRIRRADVPRKARKGSEGGGGWDVGAHVVDIVGS